MDNGRSFEFEMGSGHDKYWIFAGIVPIRPLELGLYISDFLWAKRALLQKVYGQIETALYSRKYLAYRPSMPKERFLIQVLKGSVSAMAVSGQKAV